MYNYTCILSITSDLIGRMQHPGPTTSSDEQQLSVFFTAAHEGKAAIIKNMIKVLLLAKEKVLMNDHKKFDALMSKADKAAAEKLGYNLQLISKDGYKKIMALWRKIYCSESERATRLQETLFIKLLVGFVICNSSAINRTLFQDLSNVVSSSDYSFKKLAKAIVAKSNDSSEDVVDKSNDSSDNESKEDEEEEEHDLANSKKRKNGKESSSRRISKRWSGSPVAGLSYGNRLPLVSQQRSNPLRRSKRIRSQDKVPATATFPTPSTDTSDYSSSDDDSSEFDVESDSDIQDYINIHNQNRKTLEHKQLRAVARTYGFRTSFPGSSSKRLIEICEASGVFTTPMRGDKMVHVPDKYINFARSELYLYTMNKRQDRLRALLSSITIGDLACLMSQETFNEITSAGFSKVKIGMQLNEKSFYYQYYLSLFSAMGVQLDDVSTYDNACGVKNYSRNMGWERTSGTPTQFASSTNPQIYGLQVGYYARFLQKHNLVTDDGMLKEFTATGDCIDVKGKNGKSILATVACLNLRCLLYNTKLKLPDSKRTFNHTDCNLQYVPRDTATGKPLLVGQLQTIHVLTDSHTQDNACIWTMNFVNLRKEKYYTAWKQYPQAAADKMYCVANRNKKTMKQPSASSVPVSQFCKVETFDDIPDKMPLGKVEAGDVVLFDTLTAHQVIEYGDLNTSAKCVRACEYPLYTSPYLHGKNWSQTPTDVDHAFMHNVQPQYWSHAYTGNKVGFEAQGLQPNDVSTVGRKVKPLLHMTVAPKTQLSSALLRGIDVYDNEAHLQMMEPLLTKLKSARTLTPNKLSVPQRWIDDHVGDEIDCMNHDLNRIKRKLNICNRDKQFGSVILK